MKTFLNRDFSFAGTIENLIRNNGEYKGVYLIVRPDGFQDVKFSERSYAGRFKGKDPTVSKEKLERKWVRGADILYIGKSEDSVEKRMLQHIEFWYGEPIAAWGGRVIAQIANFGGLEVWYLSCDNPKEMESTLIKEFEAKYKQLPFANWRH